MFSLPRRWILLLAALCLGGAGRANVTISYMGWGNPQEVQITNHLLAAFHKVHPEINVRYILAPDFESKLRTMMAGDIPPDVFFMPSDTVGVYAQNKTLLDLEPYIRASRFDTGDFYPQVLNAYRYKGDLYALPKDWSPQVLYYNKDLFDRDHVRYPDASWTWEDLRSAAKKLTHDFDGDGRIDQFGLQYMGGTSPTYCWFRQAGARMFTPDGRHFAMNSPEGMRALRFLHDLDFVDNAALSASTAAGRDAQAEFTNRHLAMFLGYGRWLVPRFRQMNKFRWDVAVMPHDRERYSIIYTVGYSIAAKTKHPKEAFELVKFLTGPAGAAENSRSGLALPALRSVCNSPAFLDPNSPINERAYLEELPYSEVLPRTPNPDEFNQIVDPIWEHVLRLNDLTPEQGLSQMQREVDAYLLKYRTLRAYPAVPWRGVLAGLFALAVALALSTVIGFKRGGRIGRLARQEERIGYVFIAPWLLGVLIFGVFPIVMSVLLSLCQWNAITPLREARWVGLANYHRAFTAEPKFWAALRVTAVYSLFGVPLGLVVSVAIAILMNQKVRGIPLFRTIYFLPSLVGGVSVAVLWWRIFNRDFGILNYGLMRLGILNALHLKPVDWLGNERTALPSMILMSLWGAGGGMLIYLAGLQGIPTQLYESAELDGAGKFRRFYSITLPMLSPVIFFNLIMGIIGSFQVFTQAYMLTGGGPGDATLFYVLYLYRKGFQQFEMGYASALAWVLFAVVLLLTAIVMKTSKSWVYYEGVRE